MQNIDYQRAIGDGDDDVPASSPPAAAAGKKKKRRPRNSDEESDFGSAAPESEKDDESEPAEPVDVNELVLPKQKQSGSGILKGTKSHQVYVSGKVPGQKQGKGKRPKITLPWERQNQVVPSTNVAGPSPSKTKPGPISKMSIFESRKPMTGKHSTGGKKKTVVSSISQISSQPQDSSSKKPFQTGPNPQSRNAPTKAKADTNIKKHANMPQETLKTHPRSPTKDSRDIAANHRSVVIPTHTTHIPTPTSKRKRTTLSKATSPMASPSRATEDTTLSKEDRLDTATPVEALMSQEDVQ